MQIKNNIHRYHKTKPFFVILILLAVVQVFLLLQIGDANTIKNSGLLITEEYSFLRFLFYSLLPLVLSLVLLIISLFYRIINKNVWVTTIATSIFIISFFVVIFEIKLPKTILTNFVIFLEMTLVLYISIKLSNELKDVIKSKISRDSFGVNNQVEQKYSTQNLDVIDQHFIRCINDVKGKYLFVNKQFEELSGFSQIEIVGKDQTILDSKQHDKLFFKTISSTLGKGEIWKGEICYKTRGGDECWVDASIIPQLDKVGIPFQYTTICTNLTGKKVIEKQLTLEKENAEKLIKSKSQFFASMSHEIRTPMNGVLGMLGLMMKTNLDSQQKHYATLARSSADSLLDIIDDILDLSKIEAGKLEIEYMDFNLREFLGVFAESMAYRAQDKGLEFILDITDVNESMVVGDANRFRQILSNLVGNAIKFTSQGEVKITASLKKSTENNWLFCAEITDTGMGIPQDKIKHLFNSYSQVDSSTTRKFGGTGLGLAIVKQLAQLMNGQVSLSSQLNKGSQFKFSVQFGVSAESKKVIPENSIDHLNILIVDDNASNLLVLTRQFQHWGANVSSAVSGIEALAVLNQSLINDKIKYDIAIIDMEMLGMDGIRLGKAIRKNSKFDLLKLVMMTSMAGTSDVSKFDQIGFSAYFPKPATTADLFHTLTVVNDNHQPAGQLINQPNSPRSPSVNYLTNPHVFSNAYVLLVEDNEINQAVAIGVLEEIGVKVDLAEDGLIAIEKLTNNNFYGLILMDCQMPNMDGYETTRNIRASNPELMDCKIPIIAMTANALKGDRQRCLDAGMDDYMTKPIDPFELEEKLRHWLPAEQQNHQLPFILKTLSIKSKTEQYKEREPEQKIVPKPVFYNHSKSVQEMNSSNAISDEKNIIIWDKEMLSKRVNQNEKILIKLVKMMNEKLPDLKQSLLLAVKSEKIKDIIETAHQIKGSSANLSAHGVSTAAGKIELFARNNDLNQIKQSIDPLLSQIDQLLPRLESYLHQVKENG